MDNGHAGTERGGIIDPAGHVISGAQRQIHPKLRADDGGDRFGNDLVESASHTGGGVGDDMDDLIY